MSSTNPRLRTALGGVGLAALSLVASVDAAGAAKPAAFLESSTGTWALGPSGEAQVSGSGDAVRRNKDLGTVDVTATMAADDGTLPDPGVCEPATATITVTQGGDLVAELAGSGQACGKWIQPPTYDVTHVFTGRYEIVDGARGVTGTDGWFEVRLAQTGTASTFAVDT